MPTTITQERPDTADAKLLIAELDAALTTLAYAAEARHGYSVDKLLQQGVIFFVMRQDGIPAGCGGIQLYGGEYVELKRMFVRPQFRGLGLGKLMLAHLTQQARERGYGVVRLETGIYQTEAIGLYERDGFTRIEAFGEYVATPQSLFYEKRLA